jgi:hypothetical protein
VRAVRVQARRRRVPPHPLIAPLPPRASPAAGPRLRRGAGAPAASCRTLSLCTRRGRPTAGLAGTGRLRDFRLNPEHRARLMPTENVVARRVMFIDARAPRTRWSTGGAFRSAAAAA